MISMGGCNLYGQDGSAVWLSIVGQRADTARVEIRGRQLAMLILFVPPILVVSAILVVVTQAWWAVWVLLAALPALVGIAIGVAILMSAVGVSPGVDLRRRVGPNDAGGDLSLQGQLAFWSTTLFFLPTAAIIVISQVGSAEWLRWAAIAFGLASGFVGYWLFGRMAIGYLETRLPTVYAGMRYPGDREAFDGGGLLGRLESSSQKSEDTARAAKEKEKKAKAEARRKAAALD
ncbi:MAG: hypothetical protein ACTH2Q_21535 [Propionibacteriaceae bacterium]